MLDFFLQGFDAFDEPFSSDDFNMLDEALDKFISIKSSSSTTKPYVFQKIINMIHVSFSSDDFDMKDETLDDFICTTPSSKSPKTHPTHKDIVMHDNPLYET